MEMISGGVWGPVRRANIPTDEDEDEDEDEAECVTGRGPVILVRTGIRAIMMRGGE
jgi:hypothetical protein